MRNILRYLTLPILVGITVFGCNDYPKDPANTLQQVHDRDTLRVGLLEHPPWIIKHTENKPGGVEAELVEGFSNQLGVVVKWIWGSAQSHFEALKRYELDVVVGGLIKSNPWGKHVGFSLPYFTSHTIVGVPPSHRMIRNINGVSVAVHYQSGLYKKLESMGGRVKLREHLAESDMPIVTEEWEIKGMGFKPTDIQLRKRYHVIAVPPGENPMLVALENYLFKNNHRDKIASNLWEASQ